MPITQNEEVVRFLAVLLVKIVSDEVSVPQAVQMVNKFADSLPVDQRSDARAYMTDYVFTVQETMQKQKEQQSAPEQQPVKIRRHTDPRDLGLQYQQFNPEETAWQELWESIKPYVPPAMIDTPEKERKLAWRIGYLMGYGAVNATAAAIREYGLTGGLGIIALLGWVYQVIKRK